MALFKLPVITIGRKTGAGGGLGSGSMAGSPAPERRDGGADGFPGMGGGNPYQQSGVGAGRGQPEVMVHRRVETRVVKSESRSLPTYTDPSSMFLDNAKEVIARCIQAGIIGDSSAREFFRTYSSYLEEEPAGGYEDFLTYAYKDNEEQCTQIASMLNSSLDYPLTRLEVDPSRVATGLSGILEGDMLSFCKKMRTPLLSASTADLLVFGVSNPYLSRHIEVAFKAEVPSLENSYRYYLLLTTGQMSEAVDKLLS